MLRYEVIRRIGKGSFGSVDLVRRRSDKRSFVLKKMKLDSVSEKEREMCHMEVQLLERLNHPGIVGYKESFIHSTSSETWLCIIMSHCDGGDLSNFLKKQRGKKLTEKQILDMFIQTAMPLHFVHERSILHRDLKAQNIFVKGGMLKLGDFGISKVLDGSVAMAHTMIGTPYYMSPEVFKGKPYGFKSDVWSLGCILYEIITFRHAFDANSLNGLAQKICRGRYAPIHRAFKSDVKKLIAQCLSQNPSSRPTLADILCKPFLRKRVRDYIATVHKKYGEGVISDSAYNNLKQQIADLGLSDILSNIGQVSESKVASQKEKGRLAIEKKRIEEEERARRDMETALDKLRQERKWRNIQKKASRFKSEKKSGARRRISSHQESHSNAKQNAARVRKQNLDRQRQAKRQELIAKHLAKQRKAAERKVKINAAKANPRLPPSGIVGNRLDRQPAQAPSARAPPTKNRQAQNEVEALDQWHAPSDRSPAPSKRPHMKVPKLKDPLPKDQSEIDQLRRRRELIQQRLNQLHKKTGRGAYAKNRPPRRHPFAKPERASNRPRRRPHVSPSPQRYKPAIESQSRRNSVGTPENSPSPTSYSEPPIYNDSTSSSSSRPRPGPGARSRDNSPFRYAGERIASHPQTRDPKPSPSPPLSVQQADNLNPRERMAARKRALADARALQIKEAQKSEFYVRKQQAVANRHAVRGLSKPDDDKSVDELIAELPGPRYDNDLPFNAPPNVDLYGAESAHPTPREDYVPRESRSDVSDSDGHDDNDGFESSESDEAENEAEIKELENTLAEHTRHLELLKKTLKVKQQTIAETNVDEDSESGSDVEDMLMEQEKTMQQNVVYSPEKYAQPPLKPKDESSDDDLPIGRLADRIEAIRTKCIRKLGESPFNYAYNYLKTSSFTNKDGNDSLKIHLGNLCPQISDEKLQKYVSLIDQLVFIEENY